MRKGSHLECEISCEEVLGDEQDIRRKINQKLIKKYKLFPSNTILAKITSLSLYRKEEQVIRSNNLIATSIKMVFIQMASHRISKEY